MFVRILSIPHPLPFVRVVRCTAIPAQVQHPIDVASNVHPTNRLQYEYLSRTQTHLYHYQNWIFVLKYRRHVEIRKNFPSQPMYPMNQLR